MATDSIWEDSYSPAADIIRSRAEKRAYYISIKETKLSAETARRNVLAGAIIDWASSSCWASTTTTYTVYIYIYVLRY